MIFTVENLNMQVLICSYLWSLFIFIKTIALKQLQGGLCNEFDSFSCETKFFGSAF